MFLFLMAVRPSAPGVPKIPPRENRAPHFLPRYFLVRWVIRLDRPLDCTEQRERIFGVKWTDF